MNPIFMKIAEVIKSRKTQKVLANCPWEIHKPPTELHDLINDLLDLVEYAPYYKKCHKSYSAPQAELNSCVPWRFYILDTAKCRALLEFLEAQEIKSGKISNMLAAADALVLVNWLPHPHEAHTMENLEAEPFPYLGNKENMDHIASSSAAIQNLLIGATAKNIPSYWSSGGKLRDPLLRNHLGIPMHEILLGAIFLFPEDSAAKGADIKPGQFRNQGKDRETWSKWL